MMTQITFFVHLGKEYTVAKYLASWGAPLAARVRIRHYPGLAATGRTRLKRLEQRLRARRVGVFGDADRARPGPHVYVFTDLERLNEAETEVAERLWQELAARDDTVALLNHPRRSLRRTTLLERLHAEGINDFAVYRAEDGTVPRHWPVFVREANDHSGSLSTRCPDKAALDAALGQLAKRTRPGAEILIAEFCDTADEQGVIRKYGAFRVGEAIVARHIHFSHHWVVREPDILTAESTAEERTFVETNPHADALRDIFDRAAIDYGRIDYSLRDGRIQVWEINTNPIILIPKDADDPLRADAHDAFGQRFTQALGALG